MAYQLLIKNANYYTSTGGEFVNADIIVADGKIAAIAPPHGNTQADKIIDAKGFYVLPGVIDSHVHSRDPGRTDQEDFYSVSCAAAAGGITTFCEMPSACPPANNRVNLQNRIDLAGAKAIVDFAMFGAAGFDNMEQFATLRSMGIIAFKTFLAAAPKGREAEFAGITVCDDGQLYLMMEQGAKTAARFFFHCENTALIKAMENKLHQLGISGNEFHYLSRPSVAEIESVATILTFAKATGCKVGIAHITTPGACQLVKEAKEQGVDVAAETCYQYLCYHHGHIDEYGPYAKCNPPLRSKEEMEGLYPYLLDGTITMIGSDHAPFIAAEKEIGLTEGIEKAYAGFPGIEMLLPLMLTKVAEGKLTLKQLIPLISENTARLHGLLHRKGSIEPGKDADFTIVDLAKEYTVDSSKMYTKARAVAKLFDGTKIKGAPVYTIVRGQVMMEQGKVDTTARGYGQFIPAKW